MDLTESIIPKSDQLNADDLMTGPRTVTITEVRRGSTEQPVDIVTAEFGPGRPYKPSKSMRRVMVAAWGPDTSVFTGRHLTLYRDPKIRFGSDEVGGIRISHMDHIDGVLKVALTVSRGKRAPFVVQPLKDAPKPARQQQRPDQITPEQSKALGSAFNDVGITDRDGRLDYCRNLIGRDIASSNDLTKAEASAVLDALKTDLAADESGESSWPESEGE